MSHHIATPTKPMQWLKAMVLLVMLVLAQANAFAQATVTFFHNDIAGTPLAATDSAGNLVWKETYRPYGDRLTQSPASSGNGVWFAGKPQDARTGLVYMGARYYDPTIGRFMGTDPVGFVEGNVHSVNRYAYANNNPYRYVDPDGNSPIDVAFLMWDIGKLGVAMYTGVGVAGAATDVGLSLIGVASPVPGTGQFFKGMRAVDHGVDALRVSKGPVHHICTNKNCVSTVTGGPWTPRFEAIFDKGGMKLEDALNKIAVPGHKGPHPEAYHQAVFRRLESATNGLNGSAYRDALQTELRVIGREIQTPGSVLNGLVTKP